LLGRPVIKIHLETTPVNLRSLSGSVGRGLNPGLVETVDVKEKRLLEQSDFVSGLVQLAQVIKYPGIDGMVMPGRIVVCGVNDQSAEI
jgi:hypothetical protein